MIAMLESIVPAMIVRVSVLLISGAVLYLLLRRRGPVEGARAVLATFTLVTGISLLAVSPWPCFWTWAAGSRGEPAPSFAGNSPAPAHQPLPADGQAVRKTEPPSGPAAASPALPLLAMGRHSPVSRAPRADAAGSISELLERWHGRLTGKGAASRTKAAVEEPAWQSVFAGDATISAWPGLSPARTTAGTLADPIAGSMNDGPRHSLIRRWIERFSVDAEGAALVSQPQVLGRSALAQPAAIARVESPPQEPAPADAVEAPAPTTAGVSPSNRILRWPVVVAGLFLASLTLAAGRLLLGLWAVRRLLRSGRPVDDGGLADLARELSGTLAVKQGVRLSQVAGLGSPATVGWRRVVILLPDHWREWSETERRVVLAHELAHVARLDYPAWLFARLSVVLHWYHPLAHWLAARLQLEQELAADAAAARLSGGRQTYLATLAALALRHDRTPVGWPARTLLTNAWTGTLLRRIEMLETTDRPVRHTRASAVKRVVGYGCLVGLGVFVAGVRGPGIFGPPVLSQALAAAAADERPHKADDPQAEGSAKARAANRLKLDYVPESASLVMAMRPASLSNRPEVRGMVEAYAQVPEVSRVLALMDVKSIEQITVVVMGSPLPLFIAGQNEATFLSLNGGIILRSGAPRDWLGQARGLSPLPMSEGRRGGRVYQQVVAEGFALALIQPDDQTLIIAPPHSVPLFLSRQHQAAEHPWSAAWQSVEGMDLVITADVGTLLGPVLPFLQAGVEGSQDPTEAASLLLGVVGPLWEETEQLVVGFDLLDRMAIDVVALCGTEPGAERVEHTLDALVTLGANTARRYFPLIRRQVFSEGKQAVLYLPVVDLSDELLDQARVMREARSVRFTTHGRFDLGSLVRLALLAM